MYLDLTGHRIGSDTTERFPPYLRGQASGLLLYRRAGPLFRKIIVVYYESDRTEIYRSEIYRKQLRFFLLNLKQYGVWIRSLRIGIYMCGGANNRMGK